MKRCLYCSHAFENKSWHCPHCGWQPEVRGSLLFFAPELAENSGFFKAASFGALATLEAGHFWFRARNNLIIWALGKYGAGVASFMEIGCGTGFVSQGITHSFPSMRVVGGEIHTEGISFAINRIGKGRLMQIDARRIPFVDEFDAVGAFDLLEHIEDDKKVLEQMHQALKDHGLLLLTVPQHRWLWSPVDTKACHLRRYSVKELHAKVAFAGFAIVRSTSFNSSLLPFMSISRMLRRSSKDFKSVHAELMINPMLNRLFELFLRLELWLIRFGVSFPIGGSRLIVAKKIETAVTNT